MSGLGLLTKQSSFDTMISSQQTIGSVQWTDSNSSIISVGTLTSSQLVTDTSMMSSGFWEDYESLGRSEIENDAGIDTTFPTNLEPASQSQPEIVQSCEMNAPTQTSSQSESICKDQSFSNEAITPGHRRKSFRLCSSEDSSDSDEDLEWLDNLGKPKTRFEAALRKARLAEKRRKLLSSVDATNITGRTLPKFEESFQILNNFDYFEDQFDFIQATDQVPTESSTKRSTEQSPSRPDSPVFTRGLDLCTQLESWLQTRPRKLYEQQDVAPHALQLCFISLSEQNLLNPTDPMETPVPIDLDFLNRNTPIDIDDSVDGSQLTDGLNSDSAAISVYSSGTNRKQSLLRDHGGNEDLWQRINDLDRYSGLYLEQLLEECQNDTMELALTKRLERHHRLRVAAELALSQLPKVSQMQAEVEQYNWILPSIPVAQLLKISNKPRTLLDESILQQFSLYQLQLVVNDVHSTIHSLNKYLLQELADRDDLHMELSRKCAEIGRIADHFKDLCVRLSVSRFRRTLSNPGGLVPSDHIVMHVNPDLSAGRAFENTTRIVRALFGRKSNRF